MPIFRTTASFLSGIFSIAFETLHGFITPVVDVIVLLFGWISDLMKLLEDLGVFELFGAVFVTIGGILDSVLDTVKNLVQWFANLVSGISDAVSAMANFVGDKWNDFTGWLGAGDNGNASGGFGDINANIYIDSPSDNFDAQTLISEGFIDVISEKLGRRMRHA